MILHLYAPQASTPKAYQRAPKKYFFELAKALLKITVIGGMGPSFTKISTKNQ